MVELAGEPDFSNRYLAAVKVTVLEGEAVIIVGHGYDEVDGVFG